MEPAAGEPDGDVSLRERRPVRRRRRAAAPHVGEPRALRPRRRRLGSANALCTSGARVAVPRPDVDVVAGHLWFGTLPASRPAIYVTCLRDPVVLRVSGPCI